MLFAYSTLLLSELMLFDVYVPRLNLHTGRYHVNYIWNERDTHVEGIAQLKLILICSCDESGGRATRSGDKS